MARAVQRLWHVKHALRSSDDYTCRCTHDVRSPDRDGRSYEIVDATQSCSSMGLVAEAAAATQPEGPTAAETFLFDMQGFLLLPAVLSPSETVALRTRLYEL